VPTKGSIYTLTDPRDGTIRYVGKTTKTLPERLAGHLASPTNPAMRLWINTLASQRMLPLITLVTTAAQERLGAEEERQIRRHAGRGHRLFNAPYYHQHLNDLTAPSATRKPNVALLSSEFPTSLPAFYEKQYGALARVRITEKRTAVLVAAIVALLAVGVVAYMLLRLRLVRFVAAASMVGLYLSGVGFDRLVREQLLPRLPVERIVALWDAYLAHPLMLVALHVLAAMYFHALSVYVDMRRSLPKAVDVGPPREFGAVEIAAAAARDLDLAVLEARP
jgi:hypothetical protein